MKLYQATIPKIGQHWPEQNGIYAGIARGFDDEPDSHIVLLDDMPPKKRMTWKDGMAWAASLGDGARLPNQFEMALIGANISNMISPEGFYWSASEYSEDIVWNHYLSSSNPGFQEFWHKTATCYVRAIRKLVVCKYDQQAMELCEVCGWKAKMDGEPRLVCQAQQIDKLQAAAQLGLDAFDKMTGRKPEFVEQAVAALRQALK